MPLDPTFVPDAPAECAACSDRTGGVPGARDLTVCPQCGSLSVSSTSHSLSLVRARGGRREISGEVPLDAAFRRRYELGRVLGTGGMGMVIAALERATREPVAIKVLLDAESAQALARFRREGELLQEVRHPNVTRVLEVGDLAAHPYLVMERLTGGTLRQRLADGPAPSVLETLRVMQQVLAGLAACHARGIVHRDLKPDNVLFDAAGVAKLADFGIARRDAAVDLTATGALLGTPLYFSPEQAAGEIATPASDVYAAGVILYEMLARKPPFAGNLVELLEAHISRAPAPLAPLAPDAPPALVQLVHRALEKNPRARPAGAADLGAALAAIAAPLIGPRAISVGRPPETRPAVRPPVPVSTSSRLPGWMSQRELEPIDASFAAAMAAAVFGSGMLGLGFGPGLVALAAALPAPGLALAAFEAFRLDRSVRHAGWRWWQANCVLLIAITTALFMGAASGGGIALVAVAILAAGALAVNVGSVAAPDWMSRTVSPRGASLTCATSLGLAVWFRAALIAAPPIAVTTGLFLGAGATLFVTAMGHKVRGLERAPLPRLRNDVLGATLTMMASLLVRAVTYGHWEMMQLFCLFAPTLGLILTARATGISMDGDETPALPPPRVSGRSSPAPAAVPPALPPAEGPRYRMALAIPAGEPRTDVVTRDLAIAGDGLAVVRIRGVDSARLIVVNPARRAILQAFDLPVACPLSVAPAGSHLAWLEDRAVILVDPRTGFSYGTVPAGPEPIFGLGLAPDASWLVMGLRGRLRVGPLPARGPLPELALDDAGTAPTALVLTGGAARVAAAQPRSDGRGCRISAWKLPAGERIFGVDLPGARTVHAIARDLAHAVVTRTDGGVSVVGLPGGEERVACSPDRTTRVALAGCVAWSAGAGISIAVPASGRRIATFESAGPGIEALALAPDSRHLAALKASGELTIWEVPAAGG